MTHEWKVGEWYKTRGGHEAQVLDVNFNSVVGMTILGKIKFDDCEMVYSWTKDGRYSIHAPTDFDLMPPVKREELWVNVEVVSDRYMFFYWHSKDQADNNITGDHFGMIRIVIEGNDFTVEKVTG